MHKGSYNGLLNGRLGGQRAGLTSGQAKGLMSNDRKRRKGIDDEWANPDGWVLFAVHGDSTTIDSNGSTGPGPANNGMLWNGTKFVPLGIYGPGVGTTDGSFCQQFAKTYFERTGKRVCFVNSGVGGTKVFDTWNGSSATYLASMTQVALAKARGGFPKVRFILKALVNDSTAADAVATVNANFDAWVDAITLAYPLSQIYYVMFGIKTAQGIRGQIFRAHVYEKWITQTNLHIPYSEFYLDPWGMIADGVHPSQTGYNFGANKIDSYLAMESFNYNKHARTIINSQYSSWTTWPGGRAMWINRTIAGSIEDGDWHNMLGFWCGDIIHANDRYVDWKLITMIVDRGVTYTLDDFVETNLNQTMNMPIQPTAVPYRTHSASDTFISCRIKDYKSNLTALKILFGDITGGTNADSLQTAATTGTFTLYKRNLTGITYAGGGVQDNSRLTGLRNGTAVELWQNGVMVSNGTSTAGASLNTGPEMGDRYSAGPQGFAPNMELKDWCMGLGSAVNQATFYARFETLYANI